MKKLAISSSDGVHIDEHFGKADTFYVFKQTGHEILFLEKRSVEPYCAETGQPVTGTEHSFREDRFGNVYNLLADCDILYTVQIGEIPYKKMTEKGIEVKTASCKIIDILNSK